MPPLWQVQKSTAVAKAARCMGVRTMQKRTAATNYKKKDGA
jgi:hypothetical protein